MPHLCSECDHKKAHHCRWIVDYQSNRVVPNPSPCQICGCRNIREIYQEKGNDEV